AGDRSALRRPLADQLPRGDHRAVPAVAGAGGRDLPAGAVRAVRRADRRARGPARLPDLRRRAARLPPQGDHRHGAAGRAVAVRPGVRVHAGRRRTDARVDDVTDMRLTSLTRPRRLRAGDRVVVVSPSGPVPKESLETGCAILREWGLDVVVAPHALDRHPSFDYLAGSDQDRARDLQEAWCDPSVSGVICARGGYGAQRMIELIDWAAMRAAGPKVLVGFSDITALHGAFATPLGLAAVHG